MKKKFGKSGILGFVFVIVMLLSLTACKKAEEPEEFNEKKYLKKAAENAIDELTNLANSDYVEMLSASSEVNSIIKKWGRAEIDKSEQIIVIPFGKKQVQALIDAIEESDEFDDFSDEQVKYMANHILGSIPSLINGRNGTSILAAAATVVYSRTYVPAGTIDDQIWIIRSDEDVNYSISFTNTGDGAITLSAQYIYNKDGILDDMSDALSEFFGGYDIFEIKKLKW